jgi:hypothetical protein
MTKKKLPAKPAKRKRAIPKTPAKPVKRKRAIPKTPRVPVPPPLCAHPRLVHGFLVRLATMPNGIVGTRRPISIDAAPAKTRASIPVDVRHEGPADDATFH